MSITPEDLSAQLAGGKRTAEHDRWIASAFGIVLPGLGQSSPTGAKPVPKAPPKQASEDGYKLLEPRFDAARLKVGKPAFGGVYKQLDTQQKEFETAVADYQAQIGAADDDAAAALVKAVADKLAAVEQAQVEAQGWQAVKDERESCDKGRRFSLTTNIKATPNAPAWLTAAGDAIVKADEDFNKAKTLADKKSTLAVFKSALDGAEDAMRKLNQVHKVVELLRPSIDAALKDMNAGSAATKKLRQELKAARDAYDQGLPAADLPGAFALARPVKAKLGDITLADLGGAAASAQDKRRALMGLANDPAKQTLMLTALAGSDAGAHELDAIVGGMGKKVKAGADRDFLKAALKARFGLDGLNGDLTTKALPRLYDVMKDLPDAHTRDNPKLKNITRTRKSGEGASWYKSDGDLVEINLGKTGNVGRRGGGVLGFRAKRNEEDLAGQTVKSFDTTALHEIGHSVDARFTFMSNRLGDKKYGGWGFTTVEKVAVVAGSNKLLGEAQSFFDQFAPLGRKFLTDYLVQALSGQEVVVRAAASADAGALGQDPAVAEAIKLRDAHKKPDGQVPEMTQLKLIDKAMKKCALKDAEQKKLMRQVVTRILRVGGDKADAKDAVQRCLDACKVASADAAVDWDQLVNHKAIEWCRKVRLNGGHDGLWDQGDAGATTYAVGGTVYQQSYRDTWWSYDQGARANAVSTYQFRAPGEWFAEIYAAYYQKLLSASHPYAAWFKTDVHERQA